jgi:hypothetical protein
MSEDYVLRAGVRQRRESDKVRIVLMALFARLDGPAMAAAAATIFAASLFVATSILILKGAPSGAPVGPNLSALGGFLPGYAVTWAGAIIGSIYFGIVGGIAGYALAVLWNFAHFLFVGVAVLRGNWLD